jgi:hypothetical protein
MFVSAGQKGQPSGATHFNFCPRFGPDRPICPSNLVQVWVCPDTDGASVCPCQTQPSPPVTLTPLFFFFFFHIVFSCTASTPEETPVAGQNRRIGRRPELPGDEVAPELPGGGDYDLPRGGLARRHLQVSSLAACSRRRGGGGELLGGGQARRLQARATSPARPSSSPSSALAGKLSGGVLPQTRLRRSSPEAGELPGATPPPLFPR